MVQTAQDHRPLLAVEDLTIRFLQYSRGLRRRELAPLQHVTLGADRGQMTAVVGASGSGKSLLAHAVMGILPYNAQVLGRMYFDGGPLDAQRIEALRGREIALILQGVSWLDPLMNVGRQLQNGDRSPQRKALCTKALQRYGLSEETQKLYPFQLSGGMARRVLMASAVIEAPRLIIADEPTPGLPAVTARRVLSHLRQLSQEGAAVLLITHDLELAAQTADRIAVMYEGTIVEQVEAEAFQTGEGLSHPYSQALFDAMPGHDGFLKLKGR